MRTMRTRTSSVSVEIRGSGGDKRALTGIQVPTKSGQFQSARLTLIFGYV